MNHEHHQILNNIFWLTVRNFAAWAGGKLPVFSHLNGIQTKTNYRARLQLDWHL